jgi:hypothetical protein
MFFRIQSKLISDRDVSVCLRAHKRRSTVFPWQEVSAFLLAE